MSMTWWFDESLGMVVQFVSVGNDFRSENSLDVIDGGSTQSLWLLKTS